MMTMIGAFALVGVRRSFAFGRFNALPSIMMRHRVPSLSMSSPKKVRDDNLLTVPPSLDAVGFFNDLDFIFPSLRSEFGQSFNLALDLKEKKDSFEMIMDLPGCDKKSIHLHLNKRRLTVSADRHLNEKVNENGRHIRRERHSHFSRSLTIPDSVNVDKIEAHYENGVLTITLPKLPHSDNSQSHTIPLK